MRKTLSLFLTLIQVIAFSQSSVYKPFCNNPSWTVVATNFGMSSYTTYQYQNDTVIGLHTYKKTKDINSSSFALFREDVSQKKVYQYDMINFLDYLYIDFNLNYGDPFNLTLGGSVYSLTVCTKDSMLINGCYHNKVNLSNDGGFISYNFVEGILSEINPINPFRWPGDPQVWTTCSCHNGQFYYSYIGSPFAPFNCYLTCSPEITCSIASGMNELGNINQLEVYPNPTTGTINITDKQNQFKNSTIHIKNYLGQLVLTSPFKTQVNISDLSPGIYFLTVQDRSGSKTVKIIKQ